MVIALFIATTEKRTSPWLQLETSISNSLSAHELMFAGEEETVNSQIKEPAVDEVVSEPQRIQDKESFREDNSSDDVFKEEFPVWIYPEKRVISI